MTPLGIVITTSDVFSTLMLTIVAIGVSVEKEKAKRNSAFLMCIIGTIICLCFEICNYVFNGHPEFTPLLYVTNCGVSIVGNLIIFFLIKYWYECVNERKKTNKYLIYVVSFICLANTVVQLVGSFTGFSFTIVNGEFVDNYMYAITSIVTLSCYVINTIFLVHNYKYLGKHLFKVFLLFYICPVIAVIILIIKPEYYFVLQSLAVSFLIVYIGIEKQEKENLLTTLANEDTLTGLKNRNSWNSRYEQIAKKDVNIGIFYADLNSLKYTNDNFGHLAGDTLIKDFTFILKDIFKTNEIYRVGGDEFILYFDEDLDTIPNKIEKFKKIILEKGRISSYGYEEGHSSNLDEVLKKAEALMYKDKNDYYRTTGKDRRRRTE